MIGMEQGHSMRVPVGGASTGKELVVFLFLWIWSLGENV